MIRTMIAGVALVAAVPAAAQDSGLPLWLVGKWCFVQEGAKICVRYEAGEDGMLRSTDTITIDGQVTPISTSVAGIEDGVLVRHTNDPPGLLREVSRGPNELVMARVNPVGGQSLRMRYVVSGDVLTIEFTNAEGVPPDMQRYTRERD